MLKLRESVLLKGCRENCEDGLIYNRDYAVVMDGATGLNKYNVTNYGTDAQWLTSRTLDLLKIILNNDSLTIQEILKIVTNMLRLEYMEHWERAGLDIADIEYPSAGIIIVRRVKGKIQMYRLGDCLIVAKLYDADIVLKDSEIMKLDKIVHGELVKQSKIKGIAVSEARYTDEIIDVLKYNRSLKNKPDGYWIFDPEGVAIDSGEYIETSISDVQTIYMMTDGLIDSIDIYKLYLTEKNLIESIDKNRLHRVISELTDVQDGDTMCEKFTRTKKMDDIAALVLDINNTYI